MRITLPTVRPAQDPWSIREGDFPAGASGPEQLRFLLGYAVLAPSGHNTQPWLFRIHDDGDAVDVYADRERSLPTIDPLDRELTISCGAAVGHLRVAMRRFGLESVVLPLPSTTSPDHLATVRIVGRQAREAVVREEVELFDAIPLRRTYRLPFEAVDLDGSLVARLIEHTRGLGGVSLNVVRCGDARMALADLIERADRELSQDRRYRTENAGWVRSPRDGSGDGIPAHALGHSDLADRFSPLVKFLLRNLDYGRGHGERDRALALGSPLLAVLGTATDTQAAWLACGQALSRVLLVARSRGVSASFFSQPVCVPELRRRLREIVGDGSSPQLVLRFGYGQDLPPTPRRPVDELLLHRGPAPAH